MEDEVKLDIDESTPIADISDELSQEDFYNDDGFMLYLDKHRKDCIHFPNGVHYEDDEYDEQTIIDGARGSICIAYIADSFGCGIWDEIHENLLNMYKDYLKEKGGPHD